MMVIFTALGFFIYKTLYTFIRNPSSKLLFHFHKHCKLSIHKVKFITFSPKLAIPADLGLPYYIYFKA